MDSLKAFEGCRLWLQSFLVLELFGSVWSASRPERFTPCERVSVSFEPIIKPDALVAQAVAQSLYWLSYPYSKHTQLFVSTSILLITQYDYVNANRDFLVRRVSDPSSWRAERSAKISQTIDLFYNFSIFLPVLAISKYLVFVIRKEDVRVYKARY